MKDWKVETWKDFVRVHKEIHRDLVWHLQHRHFRGTPAERNRLLRQLWKSDTPFLAANNILARINFARIWKNHGEAFGGPEECFFVTIALKRFAVGFGEAQTFNMQEIQSWVRQALAGFDFIGNVEIAPYTNWKHIAVKGYIYSIHVHLVVVGDVKERLARLKKRINVSAPSLFEGRVAFHFKKVRRGTLHRVLLYCVKAPTFEYRAYPGYVEKSDRDTGEVFKMPTGVWHQKKSKASHSVHLKVRELMEKLHLEKLIFAGGTGKAVLQQIRKDALKALPRRMRSERQLAFSGAFKRCAT